MQREIVMSLAMSQEQRETFLAGVHVGIVSISRTGRGPLAVPIWYDYTPGGDLWMLTNSSSIKGKLLAKTDRISLCVQTEATPYQYVSIEGPFSSAASTSEQLLSMAVRYLGEEQGKAYAENSAFGGDSIIVSVKPELWYTGDYSKA